MPLGIRSINKRGATHKADAEWVSSFLEIATSPGGEQFVRDCSEVMDAIAESVHANAAGVRLEPSSEVEARSRALLKQARDRFDQNATGRTLRRIGKRTGMDQDQLALALRSGELDPYAESG